MELAVRYNFMKDNDCYLNLLKLFIKARFEAAFNSSWNHQLNQIRVKIDLYGQECSLSPAFASIQAVCKLVRCIYSCCIALHFLIGGNIHKPDIRIVNIKRLHPFSVLFHTLLDYDFIHKSVKDFGCQFIIRVHFLLTDISLANLVTFVSASMTSVSISISCSSCFCSTSYTSDSLYAFRLPFFEQVGKSGKFAAFKAVCIHIVYDGAKQPLRFFLSAGRTSLFLAWAVVPRPLI